MVKSILVLNRTVLKCMKLNPPFTLPVFPYLSSRVPPDILRPPSSITKGPLSLYGTFVNFMVNPISLRYPFSPVKTNLSSSPLSLRSPEIVPEDFEIISDRNGSKYAIAVLFAFTDKSR